MEKLEKDVVKREKELGKGVTWRANYAVLGPYDYLDICEAPDIEERVRRIVAAAVIASLALGADADDIRPDDGIAAATAAGGAVSVEEVLAGRRSVRNFSNAGLSLDGAAQLLWAAQGITHSEGLRTAIRWRFTSSPALSPHCRPAFTGTVWSAPSPATDGEIWPPQAPPDLDCRCPGRSRHRGGVSANEPEVWRAG